MYVSPHVVLPTDHSRVCAWPSFSAGGRLWQFPASLLLPRHKFSYMSSFKVKTSLSSRCFMTKIAGTFAATTLPSSEALARLERQQGCNSRGGKRRRLCLISCDTYVQERIQVIGKTCVHQITGLWKWYVLLPGTNQFHQFKRIVRLIMHITGVQRTKPAGF